MANGELSNTLESFITETIIDGTYVQFYDYNGLIIRECNILPDRFARHYLLSIAQLKHIFRTKIKKLII